MPYNALLIYTPARTRSAPNPPPPSRPAKCGRTGSSPAACICPPAPQTPRHPRVSRGASTRHQDPEWQTWIQNLPNTTNPRKFLIICNFPIFVRFIFGFPQNRRSHFALLITVNWYEFLLSPQGSLISGRPHRPPPLVFDALSKTSCFSSFSKVYHNRLDTGCLS